MKFGVPVTSRLVHTVFFEPDGPGRYRATIATAGPWSAQAQHGGPPSALAARELERHEPDEGMRLARVAVDILRPIPVDVLTARTRTLRPGRRVALLETVLEARGQEVLYARGWRIGTSAGLPVIGRDDSIPEVPPKPMKPAFPGGFTDGYLTAIDWRFAAGGFDQTGPSLAWGRPRIPLLPGEELSPMCRTLLIADSGNGVGAVVDPREFQFLNVDLTVVLQRDPEGEWILLEPATTMGGQGTGLAQTAIFDRGGYVGTGMQTLLVSRVVAG